MSSNKRFWIIISASICIALLVISIIFYNRVFRPETVEDQADEVEAVEVIEDSQPEIPVPPQPTLDLPTPSN